MAAGFNEDDARAVASALVNHVIELLTAAPGDSFCRGTRRQYVTKLFNLLRVLLASYAATTGGTHSGDLIESRAQSQRRCESAGLTSASGVSSAGRSFGISWCLNARVFALPYLDARERLL